MIKIVKPKIFLLASTHVDCNSIAEYLQHTSQLRFGQSEEIDDADWLAEIAGRVCYQSFSKPRPGGNPTYLQHIKECGHGSVLEHSSATVLLTGVSRSFTHELVRHRAGFSYSQLSQRYVDESDTAFICPPTIKEGTQEYTEWKDSCEESLERYRNIVKRLSYEASLVDISQTDKRKIVRQSARSVLPNCTETHIVTTANLRAWRHFFELRCTAAADTEMRTVAYLIYQTVRRIAPNIFADYQTETLPDGTTVLTTIYKKV